MPNLVSPTPAPLTQEYIVEPGDTPTGVALIFGTTVETLIALNADSHPEMGERPMKFISGWTIRVPRRSSMAVDARLDTRTVILPPVATPANAALAATDGYFDENEAPEIVRLANEERAKHGLWPLAVDEQLMAAARRRAVEIVSDFSHAGSGAVCDGGCGENIGWSRGAAAASAFVQSWMDSPAHRENVLREVFVSTGVAVYRVDNKSFATQLFR